MITPEYLNEVIEGTQNKVQQLNNLLMIQVIKRIIRAFLKGGELLIPATLHDLHKIAQSGYSIAQIQQEIERVLPSIQKEIHQAFVASANEIAKYQDEFTRLLVENEKINVDMPEYTFQNIPTSASDLHMTTNEILVLENAYKRTNHTVKNITQTTAVCLYDDYIDACDTAYMKVQAGMAPSKAVQESIEDLVDKGITTVDYISGHQDKVDVAVARAVRTGINQANSEIILTRCSEMGIQYVKVSQHLGARVTKHNDYTNHSWWQGKVYSLDWNSPILQKNLANVPLGDKEFGYLQEIKQALMKPKQFNYPDFVETCGYGDIQGIAGINCRHTFQMWFPDINVDHNDPIDPKANEDRYKKEQQQRAMERAIRKLKGKRDALKQLPETPELKKQINALTGRINDRVAKYRDFCNKNRLPYYSDRLGKGVI